MNNDYMEFDNVWIANDYATGCAKALSSVELGYKREISVENYLTPEMKISVDSDGTHRATWILYNCRGRYLREDGYIR